MKTTAVCPHCNVTVSFDLCDTGIAVACGGCSIPFSLPSVDLPQGYDVNGFVVEEKIGTGAMGNVYKAIQKSMNRPVALKIIKPEITQDERNIADFIKEIQLLASFNHPNIVTAIEAGNMGNIHFLAMEYMEGISLDEPLTEGQRFSEKDTLELALPIAEALLRAWNEYKLIHCDIKPANIMLDRNNNPKLMDLGISQCAHEQHTDGTIIGTPFYMSPEQSRGQTLDFRSDMFSLGASMFHMLTGKYPFYADNPTDVMKAVQNSPIDTQVIIDRGASKGICTLISKMLEKVPEERYESWEKFIEDVQACLKPKKSAASNGSVRKKAGKPKAKASSQNVNRARKVISKRKKGQGALLYILLAMGLTGGVTYFAVNEYIGKKGGGSQPETEEKADGSNIKFKIKKKKDDEKEQVAEKSTTEEKAAPEPVKPGPQPQPEVILPTPDKGLKSTFTPPKTPES